MCECFSSVSPPHVSGQAFTTSTRSPPVLESNNRYSILPIEDTNDSSLEDEERVVRAPPKLTKRLASSSSPVKASNEKATTISPPILTTTHQSRPPFGEFQAAVTNAQSDGAEQAPSANSDEVALLVGKVPPWGSSRTTSLEGIAIGGETSPGTEWNMRRLKSKSPREEASTKAEASQRGGQRTVGAQEAAPTEKTPEPVGQGKDGADAIEAARRDSLVADPSRTVGPEEQTSQSRPSASKSQEGAGQAGKSVHSAQVEPAVPDRTYGMDWDGPSSAVIDSHPDNSSGYRGAKERKEATSAQAVKRGHQVTMIEVPDDEDDTSFWKWVAGGSPTISQKRKLAVLLTPPESPTKTTSPLPNEGVGPTCVSKNKMASPMVAVPSTTSAKVREVSHRWF